MFIDGHIQFSALDEHRYHEMLVHPLLNIPGQVKRVLILGGGDGLAAREVLKYKSVEHIDLVDIDPAITNFGKEFEPLRKLNRRSLMDPRVHVANEDAFVFVNQPGVLYDRVIIDMPDPHNEALSKLYSKEFYTMIARRLSPHGAVVTQSSSPFFARRAFWAIEATLRAVFADTMSYQSAIPSFGLWGFNVAAKQPIPPQFRPDFEVATRSLTAESFAAARIFSKDIGQISDLPVNTIFEPTLYQLYVNDLAGRGS